MVRIVMVDCAVRNNGTVFASDGPGFDIEAVGTTFDGNDKVVDFGFDKPPSTDAVASGQCVAPRPGRIGRFMEGVSLNAIGSALGNTISGYF